MVPMCTIGMYGPHVYNRDGWSPCVQYRDGWFPCVQYIGIDGPHVYNRDGWSQGEYGVCPYIVVVIMV